MPAQERKGRAPAWLLASIAGAGFFALALSDTVYDVASPSGLPHHVIVRKLYSLACFALLGFLLSRSLPASRWSWAIARTALAIGVYSAFVEIGQRFAGSHESLKWNAVDIIMGLLGGGVGGAVDSMWSSVHAPAEHLRNQRGT